MKKQAPDPKPIKQHVLGLRVTEDVKAQIEAAAAAREWSVSQWLAFAARSALSAGRKLKA